jgi:hypothetical protein
VSISRTVITLGGILGAYSVLGAAGAGVALAKGNPGPKPPPVVQDPGDAGPTSMYDIYGDAIFSEAGSAPTVQPNAAAPITLAALDDCTFPGHCEYSGLQTSEWAQNIRFNQAGTANCITGIAYTPATLFQGTFTPVSGAQYVTLTMNVQASIGGAGPGSVLQGNALVCTVTQGTQSVNCPGTTVQPFLVRQTTNKGSVLAFTAYHGTVKLANDTDDFTVSIQVRSSDQAATGAKASICYPWVEIVQHYSPPA